MLIPGVQVSSFTDVFSDFCDISWSVEETDQCGNRTCLKFTCRVNPILVLASLNSENSRALSTKVRKNNAAILSAYSADFGVGTKA